MKNLFVTAAIAASVFFCAQPCLCQTTYASPAPQTKTCDVNKDGQPDVIYYSDGKYCGRAEADTNYNGKADVVVHTKDGKFHRAEADTDHDGTMDTQFTDLKDFDKWLNTGGPDFKDKLIRDDWEFGAISF